MIKNLKEVEQQVIDYVAEHDKALSGEIGKVISEHLPVSTDVYGLLKDMTDKNMLTREKNVPGYWMYSVVKDASSPREHRKNVQKPSVEKVSPNPGSSGVMDILSAMKERIDGVEDKLEKNREELEEKKTRLKKLQEEHEVLEAAREQNERLLAQTTELESLARESSALDAEIERMSTAVLDLREKITSARA